VNIYLEQVYKKLQRIKIIANIIMTTTKEPFIGNIVYYIKEYFAVIFYFLVIFNVIISVIYSKSKKSSKKKSKKGSTKKSKKRRNRKGGGFQTFSQIFKIILCFLTFGVYCPGRGKEYYMWIFGDSDPRTASSLYKYQTELEDDVDFHKESKIALKNSLNVGSDVIPDDWTMNGDEMINEWAKDVEYVFKYGIELPSE